MKKKERKRIRTRIKTRWNGKAVNIHRGKPVNVTRGGDNDIEEEEYDY